MGYSSGLSIVAALALAACAQPPKPAPAPIVVAPVPIQYSCQDQAKAAAELETLGPDAMVGRMIADYGLERRVLRRARGEPDPAPCA